MRYKLLKVNTTEYIVSEKDFSILRRILDDISSKYTKLYNELESRLDVIRSHESPFSYGICQVLEYYHSDKPNYISIIRSYILEYQAKYKRIYVDPNCPRFKSSISYIYDPLYKAQDCYYAITARQYCITYILDQLNKEIKQLYGFNY